MVLNLEEIYTRELGIRTNQTIGRMELMVKRWKFVDRLTIGSWCKVTIGVDGQPNGGVPQLLFDICQ